MTTVKVPLEVMISLRDLLRSIDSSIRQAEEHEKFLAKARSLGRLVEDSVRPHERPEYIATYKTLTAAEKDEIRKALVVDPKKCDHQKGGKTHHRGARRDYNFRHHTFIDGSESIRCLTCKREWRPGDKQWPLALKAMQTMSTNRKTASENSMFFVNFSDGRPSEGFHNLEELKKKYPNADTGAL